MLELHHRSQHIVREVVVGQQSFELPELLQPQGREVSNTCTHSRTQPGMIHVYQC